ncbi:MAG: hypothetical protein U9R00_00820 [Patescibacteria group bacterium]|nr:hypothetical protein [Patescibacteria group bacterium]
MKKIGFFNTLALYIGGTYIEAFKNQVIFEYYRLRIIKWRLKLEHTHTENYKKDGKIIVTDFNTNGTKTIRKLNYLDYNFKRFAKFEIL